MVTAAVEEGLVPVITQTCTVCGDVMDQKYTNWGNFYCSQDCARAGYIAHTLGETVWEIRTVLLGGA